MTEKEFDAVNVLAREGGLARARTLTPEQRSKIAQNAAHARWARDARSEVMLVSHMLASPSADEVRQTELDAFGAIWSRVQNHTTASTCPCDECVASVIAAVRNRYLAILGKIDRNERLDKDEKELFRRLVGEKPDRWTRIYREECKKEKHGKVLGNSGSVNRSYPRRSRGSQKLTSIKNK
jgi:hypothetical protein